MFWLVVWFIIALVFPPAWVVFIGLIIYYIVTYKRSKKDYLDNLIKRNIDKGNFYFRYDNRTGLSYQAIFQDVSNRLNGAVEKKWQHGDIVAFTLVYQDSYYFIKFSYDVTTNTTLIDIEKWFNTLDIDDELLDDSEFCKNCFEYVILPELIERLHKKGNQFLMDSCCYEVLDNMLVFENTAVPLFNTEYSIMGKDDDLNGNDRIWLFVKTEANEHTLAVTESFDGIYPTCLFKEV